MIEISVPADRRARLRGVIVHRVSNLVPAAMTSKGPLRLTDPARTYLDTCSKIPPNLCERLLEEWLADRLTTVAKVRTCLDRDGGRGRAGLGRARSILEDRVLGDEAADSTDEPMLLRVLREHGGPLPAYHHIVRDDTGRALFDVDYAYVEERLGLEVHGFGIKTRHRATFEAMLARANALGDERWEIRHHTPNQVLKRPWAVCREIETARTHRAGELGLT